MGPTRHVDTNIEQKVDEFVKQVDLVQLYSLTEGIEPVLAKTSGKNSPVSRPSNCFFQFKKVVSKYAAEKLIPGHNDQNILSKAQSRLWASLSNDQKRPFKKLAEEAVRAHKEMYPDYEFHPHRDKSVLKIKISGSNGGQSRKKKNPSEKPDQKNQNLVFNQDSTSNLNLESNRGDFDIVTNLAEDVSRQNAYNNNSTIALPIIDESNSCMGSQSQDQMIEFQDQPFLYIVHSPDGLSAPQYITSPISPAISDCSSNIFNIISSSEFSSPYPSPNSQIGETFDFQSVPSMTTVPTIEHDLQMVPSMDQATTPLTWQVPVADNNNMLDSNNGLMINVNNIIHSTSNPSSPALSFCESNFSIQASPNLENMENSFMNNYTNDFPFCSELISDPNIMDPNIMDYFDQII
ncbi:7353_t:CDS:1 [Cetraspora pellucida]|uniref:7353_t:CDS:1 n=1 Tax=Cetraspora pellucida TaxID=1433469 RepID=A0A9N9F1W2_9GLOM|nr:7353_t:CDS:1 [Cetraspora pellucida]